MGTVMIGGPRRTAQAQEQAAVKLVVAPSSSAPATQPLQSDKLVADAGEQAHATARASEAQRENYAGQLYAGQPRAQGPGVNPHMHRAWAPTSTAAGSATSGTPSSGKTTLQQFFDDSEQWLRDRMPVDGNIASLDGYPSGCGGRRLDGAWVPELSFEPFGYLSARGAAAIRERVAALDLASDQMILLRGQKRLTPGLDRLPVDPEQRRQEIWQELSSAAAEHQRSVQDQARCKVMGLLIDPSGQLNARIDKLHRDETPLDALIAHHQSTSGSRLLISATRSLSVSAGDYDMRVSDNRNRYIYLLAAPKDQLVNVYARAKDRQERLVGKSNPPAGEKSDLDTLREAEISVWLDATPYIAGIYDAVEERWVETATAPASAAQDNC